MKAIDKEVLEKVAGVTEDLEGAHSLRLDGKSYSIGSSDTTTVTPREDGDGIDIHVKANTKNETIYIPVVISESGVEEVVKNDFYIGENAEITIIAGCGIHNDEENLSQHDGIHTFYLEKNSHVTYIENHYGSGKGTGDRVLNPVTNINMDEGSQMYMETVQIEGVNSTKRLTTATLGNDTILRVDEKLLTTGNQYAETTFNVNLDGEKSSAEIVSRSVAQGKSKQYFLSKVNGNTECMGHSECDAIIMDEAIVVATPEITANHVDAELIHEAAIGKIAGEQLTKLMTLGLTEDEAEHEIITGFLQ